jgi:hypothetical protein
MLAQSDYAADTVVRIEFFFELCGVIKISRNFNILTRKLYLILIEYLNIVLVRNVSIVCLRQYYNRYNFAFPWNRN